VARAETERLFASKNHCCHLQKLGSAALNRGAAKTVVEIPPAAGVS
jgi:hypothetical protein